MPFRPPTVDDLQELGERLHFDLTDEELEFFREQAIARGDAYETVRSYEPEPRLGGREVRRRSSGIRPSETDDPHNAWVSRCRVEGDDDGDLSGWTIAVKDNVCVAGVEMTCGSIVLEGYVPNVDATVVSRVLDAGATVIGKTNMDDMAMSRTGHSAFGPITNPHDEAFLAGGSSGGSAVAVATGEADVALGSDQGGSVRIPAAICGVVGHKPTYGLVPYTGCIGLEHAIDHPGPIGPDVESVARVLTTIAGSNERDLRAPDPVPVEQYEDALEADVSTLTMGLLTEGFDRPGADDGVVETARQGAERLGELVDSVEEVSVPMHRDAEAIHSVCSSEGLLDAMIGEGLGHGWKAWYNTSWVEAFGKFRRTQADDFPAVLKQALLVGAYMNEQYHSRYYAEGMNLVVELTERYDALLDDVDLLAMPTVVNRTPKRKPELDEFERLRSMEVHANTSAFNRTGHPAVSVPVGTVDGLPVGLSIVASRFDDATALAAARAIERELDLDLVPDGPIE